eukprot:scaffold8015_cov165-Ochromonas_danica.AAC.8
MFGYLTVCVKVATTEHSVLLASHHFDGFNRDTIFSTIGTHKQQVSKGEEVCLLALSTTDG